MKNSTMIYNNPIEIGSRIAMILNCLEGEKLDLDELAFLDFVLIYSEEFEGPRNLHPVVPNYLAELPHKRSTLHESLDLFISRGLINKLYDSDGIVYEANDLTHEFVSCLKSNYYKLAWKNLIWIEDNLYNLKFKYRSNINLVRLSDDY
ncbi:TPA: ABC-three component system middle component 2 [Vibrio alginolyticus]|uniref:ABC-three component system middle component 2 n=1 Tax=Vibrio alginolyticus TaxID=663 RepID=UPI00216044BC|nr:ABC-three component system middle component 2 [Vibrio alginolyticus]MCS0180618.1 hypothetical protein [Vibrio alginolyticus]